MYALKARRINQRTAIIVVTGRHRNLNSKKEFKFKEDLISIMIPSCGKNPLNPFSNRNTTH